MVDVCGQPSRPMDAAKSELLATDARMACMKSKHVAMAAESTLIAAHRSGDVSSEDCTSSV